MINELQVGPQKAADGGKPTARGGNEGQTVASDLHGRHYEASKRGSIFVAQAVVTAPVIYTTAAGTGGPFIWNGSSTVNVNLLKLGYALTTASGVVGALGITGGSSQNATPTSTTAIDSRANLYIGGPASAATPYRVATPAAAGTFLMPVLQIGTIATSVTEGLSWFDLDGIITIPPNSWAAVAASATLTSCVIQICLVYEEVLI